MLYIFSASGCTPKCPLVVLTLSLLMIVSLSNEEGGRDIPYFTIVVQPSLQLLLLILSAIISQIYSIAEFCLCPLSSAPLLFLFVVPHGSLSITFQFLL
jgi:hypothetical protein